MLDVELRKQKEKLKLILNTLYRTVAFSFKDYALGRFFVKDFDDLNDEQNGIEHGSIAEEEDDDELK